MPRGPTRLHDDSQDQRFPLAIFVCTRTRGVPQLRAWRPQQSGAGRQRRALGEPAERRRCSGQLPPSSSLALLLVVAPWPVQVPLPLQASVWLLQASWLPRLRRWLQASSARGPPYLQSSLHPSCLMSLMISAPLAPCFPPLAPLASWAAPWEPLAPCFPPLAPLASWAAPWEPAPKKPEVPEVENK